MNNNELPKKSSWLKVWLSTLKYSNVTAFLMVLASVLLVYTYHKAGSFSNSEKFWTFLDPVAGIGTLLITLVVLLNQGKDKYLNSLEKRLTIHYKYKGKQVMYIENAYLSGESDIRQTAYSLGGILFKGRLNFDMVLETLHEKQHRVGKDKNYLHYEVTLFLNSDPRTANHSDKSTSEEDTDEVMYDHSSISRGDEWIWKRNN